MDVVNTEAVGYVRPHHMKIERSRQSENAIPAKVTFAHSVGPVWHIEMKREDIDEYVEVELNKAEYTELKLEIGELVYVRPKEVRVFVPEDFVI